MADFFKNGTIVEVSSDEEGFRGAWYIGTVIRRARGKNKFVVEYKTLLAEENSSTPLQETLDLVQMRPFQPPDRSRSFAFSQEVDAYHNDGWWEGVITAILPDDVYSVFFRGTREQLDFGLSDLRLHREWDNGKWTPPFEEQAELQAKSCSVDRVSKGPQLNVVHFSKGKAVEVSSEEEGFQGAWFSAKVIEQMGNKFIIEYKTLRNNDDTALLKEVDSQQMRPDLPKNLDCGRSFRVGDEVDAFHNDGWWEGYVVEVLHDDMYTVYFRVSRDQHKFGPQNIRIHRKWFDGKWIPPLQEETKPSLTARKKQRVNKKPPEKLVRFRKGTAVEVNSDEEGFVGAWFSASVIEQINNKFIIEYKTLRNNDDTAFLREKVDNEHIRPDLPKNLDDGQSFKIGDEVDAYHNDGWWEGVIVDVLPYDVYSVFFRLSKEQIDFGLSDIRIHREWSNGKWIPMFQEEIKSSSRETKKECISKDPPLSAVHYSKGTDVEVSSDEEGFRGAWFSATVIEQINTNKFRIEYKSLRNEDDTAFLQEEVTNQHIRPNPPKSVVVDRFNQLEEVDALYNDGWWVGIVSKVLGRKYMVYFRGTNEELEFNHDDLRLHHEWINGKWILANQEFKLD